MVIIISVFIMFICFVNASTNLCIKDICIFTIIPRLEGINFVRIQMANTINRVIENIRPHNDVVLVHIGPTELSEACHSINTSESVAGQGGGGEGREQRMCRRTGNIGEYIVQA